MLDQTCEELPKSVTRASSALVDKDSAKVALCEKHPTPGNYGIHGSFRNDTAETAFAALGTI